MTELALTRKVIGRILSIGFPMPGPLVDNYNAISAPSFFDYDALVFEPRATSRLIESVLSGETEARTHSDARAVAGRPAPGEASLIDVLRRRHGETAALLAHGGAVVAFAHPADAHRLAEGVELDDYWWLPLSATTVLRPPLLIAGDGTTVDVVDYTHPLAAFVLSQAANTAYRAHLDATRMKGGWVFARSRGGAAVGVELPVERGRIVLLPALRGLPAGDARYAMSEALQAGIRRALGVQAEGRPPPWVAAHPLAGLDDRRAALDAARSRLDAAQRGVAAAEAEHDGLARYQRLLWQEGAIGLEAVVVEALRLIGFEAYDADREDLTMRAGGEPVLVEIEASEAPVGLAPHYRLRQRIERAIARGGAAPRGVLFVNGERLLEPGQRTDAAHELVVAAETMRYCLATTASLYGALAAHLRGETHAVAGYRRALMETDGLIAPI